MNRSRPGPCLMAPTNFQNPVPPRPPPASTERRASLMMPEAVTMSIAVKLPPGWWFGNESSATLSLYSVFSWLMDDFVLDLARDLDTAFPRLVEHMSPRLY